jgi:hypothetical protein
MVNFFYDIENNKRNFTSITGECPDLSFLPFLIDNVAVSDCCNSLILWFCLGGYYWIPLCRLQFDNPELEDTAT